MKLHHGDCLEVMAGMEPESVDAVVTDPPYGLEFMGKEWDKLRTRGTKEVTSFDPQGKPTITHRGEGWQPGSSYGTPQRMPKCAICGKWKYNGWKPRQCSCDEPQWVVDTWTYPQNNQRWHQAWAEAVYRVAKPSAYLLAFGGTRTVHRLTSAIEDAGWIIRDMLVWAYASGFPKSKASLKPAWEPIVMARKPGPLRELAIDECRIGYASDAEVEFVRTRSGGTGGSFAGELYGDEAPGYRVHGERFANVNAAGRWPANVILTDPIFDGGWEGVVGGGEARGEIAHKGNLDGRTYNEHGDWGLRGIPGPDGGYGDSGTYSRFFLIPKADRSDREPVVGWSSLGNGFEGGASAASMGREGPPHRSHRTNSHPTVKPVDLMRHLVRLVTPTGGTVLDPFAGSGSTLIAAEMEGFDWVGIEKEAEYVAIAEARLNGTQRGLGLPA